MTSYLVGHGDTFAVDERQDLVVVHDGVHALDPERVDRAVKDQPLLVQLLVCHEITSRAARPQTYTAQVYSTRTTPCFPFGRRIINIIYKTNFAKISITTLFGRREET